MIRLQTFEADNLIPVLSGVLSDETTPESYVFINTLLKLFPKKEAIQEAYLIMSALEGLSNIYTNTKLVPAINKDVILDIIDKNIYEELKENKAAGFRQYSQSTVQVELDVFNDEIIALVADSLLASVEEILDQAIELGYDINQSSAAILQFHTKYKNSLLRESAQLLEMMGNSDMVQVRMHFWGWSFFLNRYRIYSSSHAGTLLTLLADHVRVKDSWSVNAAQAITSMEQIIELEEEQMEIMNPMVYTQYEAFDKYIKLTRQTNTVIVASKGGGKTTLAASITGSILNQGKRVLFYSPESKKTTLLLDRILPSYIRSRFGFAVTGVQVMGIEEPYVAGSQYTQEEKKVLINVAKQDLADGGNFKHVSEYYMFDTFEEDLRADVKSFNPDFIIFDHTLELRGNVDGNTKTSKVAEVLKSINKDFGTHNILLSHPSPNFSKSVPTVEEPISLDKKLVKWSADVESLADNVIGMIKGSDNMVKMFFTKIREGVIPPMFQVFRIIPTQCWFDYLPEDQYIQTSSIDKAVDALMNGTGLEHMIGEDEDDNDGDGEFEIDL